LTRCSKTPSRNVRLQRDLIILAISDHFSDGSQAGLRVGQKFVGAITDQRAVIKQHGTTGDQGGIR